MKGAAAADVQPAIDDRNPLPGTYGFAGILPDGALVRDVLGRQPLFYDSDTGEHAFEPRALDAPVSFPAGHRFQPDDQERPERVFELPDPDPCPDEHAALDALRRSLGEAFDGVDTGGLAVAFSGGVDSALVADEFDAPLYVVGYEGSADIDSAIESADVMGRDLTVHEVSLADIEDAIPDVARAIDRTDAMDVQIALPLYLVSRRVAADGYDRLALGQGADELFAGYAKIAKAPTDPRVEAETVRGARREVLETLPDQLERDSLAIRSTGVEPVTPLLHDSVVEAALQLPASLLVHDGTRKVALRQVAGERLPAVVASRDKKAVQYGSLVAREVDRLARRAGFKRRMDDHIKQYIDSRLEGTGTRN